MAEKAIAAVERGELGVLCPQQFTEEQLERLAAAVEQSTELNWLAICNCAFATIAPLARAVEKSKTLESLSIRRCRIVDNDVATLAHAVAQSTSLRIFFFDHNPLMTDADAVALAHELANAKSLRGVSLDGCAITDQGAAEMVRAFDASTGTSLDSIFIHDTHVTPPMRESVWNAVKRANARRAASTRETV